MRELVAAWPPTATRVDGQRAQALRRGVHRGGQPGRPGADDDDVVAALRAGRRRSCPSCDGQVAGRRPLEHAARRDGDRQVGGRDAEAVEQHGDVGVGVGVDPWWGSRLRAAYSRSAIEAGVNSDPMICSVSAAADISAARRARNASRTVSLSADVGQHPGPEHLGRDDDDLARLGDHAASGTAAGG